MSYAIPGAKLVTLHSHDTITVLKPWDMPQPLYHGPVFKFCSLVTCSGMAYVFYVSIKLDVYIF